MILFFWSLDCWFSEGSDGGEAPVLAAAYGGGRANFFEELSDKGNWRKSYGQTLLPSLAADYHI